MERAGRHGRDAADGQGACERVVLAAVRRAALHEGGSRQAVPLRTVLAHLAIPQRTRRARELRVRLEGLRDRGLLTTTRAHGVVVWALAPEGSRLLAAAETRGRRVVLPEAPQHRAWRAARAAAGQELGLFADELRADLREAVRMLDALGSGDGAPHSDAWLALGPRLLGDCRRLGSAWHCLHEWPEPSDAAADTDPAAGDALRAGRRNLALWARRP